MNKNYFSYNAFCRAGKFHFLKSSLINNKINSNPGVGAHSSTLSVYQQKSHSVIFVGRNDHSAPTSELKLYWKFCHYIARETFVMLGVSLVRALVTNAYDIAFHCPQIPCSAQWKPLRKTILFSFRAMDSYAF